MIYTELVTSVLAISIILYVILGGADYGAGIVEIFSGSKANETISKAMAPVWEANHMWLVIAIVILFNGFPEVYKILSTNLHIPVFIFLIGIVFRGAAFTFRHYDPFKDQSQKLYSYVFRFSSLFTVFFLGVTISAFIGGTIPISSNGTFHELYISPWFNLFSISMGMFLSILSAYIASIFLLSEVETKDGFRLIQKFNFRLFIASIFSGSFVFVASHLCLLNFHIQFFKHPISIFCAFLATLFIPLIFWLIQNKNKWPLRIAVGAQVLLIIVGWLSIQWPNFLVYNDQSVLTIYAAAAPDLTMKILFFALAIGVIIIFPALFYLFKIFKTEGNGNIM